MVRDVLFRRLELKEGWRNEKYRIYASNQSSALSEDQSTPRSNWAFALERAACAIFGFATFGVHMTGVLKSTARAHEQRMKVTEAT